LSDPASPSTSIPSLSWDDSGLLIESIQDYAIFMLDTDGRVATWNLGAERIKGYSAGEIVGRHFEAFYPPEDRDAGKPLRILETARELGRVEDEGWRVRKDGSRFWANVVITALRGADGRLRGFGKVTRDLSARRQAEETERALLREQVARVAAEDAEARLRDSEERYRSLSERLEVILEGVADGIAVQDRSGRLLFTNTAAARACGFASRAELMAATPAEVLARFELLDEHGSPFDPAQLPGQRVLRGEGPLSLILRVRERASGGEWWLSIRASAVLDSDGQPELAISVWHDVSAERREQRDQAYLSEAAAALSSSLDHESMLGALANVLVPGLADLCSVHLLEGGALRPVAISHVDPTKLPLVRRMQRDYPPDPGAPEGPWNVLHSGRSDLVMEVTDELLVKRAQDGAHLEMLRVIGPRSVLIVPIRSGETASGTLTMIRAESGSRYDHHDLPLLEEVGRRAGLAVEHARLYAASQEATKRAESAALRAQEASRIKDEFLATVSHELRTPLNAIVGWSSLLKTQNRDPTIARAVDVIFRNAQTQSKLIEDILDVSRIITGKLRLDLHTTDLMTIVNDAVEVIRPSASAKRISVEVTASGPSHPFVGDPERLQQVVWNLLSNAVKFTDTGGTIAIELNQDGSRLILSVKDSGRGIEPDFLPYVFDRFKQADSSTTRRVGGLGLGLSIVRHIVELHGGQVQASSAGVGQGSTFSITLPIRATAPPRVERERHEPEALEMAAQHRVASLDGVRVLVVDDEPDARDLLMAVLTQAGAKASAAASASEGFALVQESRPHVLVSDLGMPDVDGYTMMKRIRSLTPERGGAVPAIALSAYTRLEDRAKALAVGFHRHIGKPVNPDALVASVAELAQFGSKV
jgi:PAS domain S-box-containing protein